MLIDTHCHLDDEAFDGERQDVVERALQNGIAAIINPGTNLASSRKALALAERFEIVWAAVGIHPNDGNSWTEKSLDALKENSAHRKNLAIGEIGLDYYRDWTAKDKQREIFLAQLELAAKLDLPVIIHNREADADLMDILADWQKGLDSDLAEHPGVLHSFSGDQALAERALEHHFMIGITGPVTFNKATDLQEIARSLPLDRLLVETDSPYLSPHPERGKRNEPARVKLVAEKIAALKGLEADEVFAASTANAKRLFGLEPIL